MSRGARRVRGADAGAAADNSIGDAGAAAIAEALKVNKSVTTIDLSCACRASRRVRGADAGAAADYSIGDAGAAAVAEALKVNKTVTTIRLCGACRAARGGSVVPTRTVT